MKIEAGKWLRMPSDLRMIYLRRAAIETKRKWSDLHKKQDTN